MGRLTHEAKVAIAKRLRTQREVAMGVSLWQTAGWERRKERIQRKVAKVEEVRKMHAARRREAAKNAV